MKFEKARNIRDLRELMGLNQEEFANLAGISAVYLSQIENGRRPLTLEAAEKIANAISELISNVPNILYRLDPEELKIGHIASFYDEDLQGFIIEKMEEIDTLKSILRYALSEREIPSPEFKDERFGKSGVSTEFLIRKEMDTVRENVKKYLSEFRKENQKNKLLTKDYYRHGDRE